MAQPTKTSPARHARLRDLLHQAGLKATPARIRILVVLQQLARPLSVQAIGQKVPGFDQATIYRALKTLQAHGLVRRIDWQHGHAHFEVASLGDHHHVVCTHCHRIADTDCAMDDIIKKVLAASGFATITEHSVEFFGLCQHCTPR